VNSLDYGQWRHENHLYLPSAVLGGGCHSRYQRTAIRLGSRVASRPVRIIVPAGAGDGPDSVARLTGNSLQQLLGQPFVIVNMAGAGGVVGSQAAAKAAPDGYTLIMGNAGSHGINAAIYPNLSYDPVEDFVPISMILRSPNIFVASRRLGVKTLGDLIKLAKSGGRTLTYASGGNGSSAHLNTEYLKLLAGFNAVQVPYRGATPALNDLMAGQDDFMAVNLPPALELVKSGNIVGLAVTSARRSNQLLDVPTVAESGFPGYETVAWFGLLAPRGTPPAVVQTLHRAIEKACQGPELIEKLTNIGGDVVCNRPEEFAATIRSDVQRWRQVVRDAAIHID
jgi:tripartite-type tricarboxylate transporter receptor subunit TctC